MKDRSMRFFMMICRKTQKELKEFLYKWLRNKYDFVVNEDGFLYAKGSDKVLMTAHMDTVHKTQCKIIEIKNEKGKRVLSSKDGIGGDDRCGIFMILRILETTKLRPSILFCEDEEIGGIGSNKFCNTKYITDLEEMMFLVELDRAHSDDLVYYRDGNDEFHKFCEETTGYKRAYGTFSDISHLSPECLVSSVNVSCGYYNAHKTNEYVVFDEMENSINAVIKLVTEGIRQNKNYTYKSIASLYSYSRYYDDYDYGYGKNYGYGCGNYYKKNVSPTVTAKYKYTFKDYDGVYYIGYGSNLKEAVGDAMMNHPTLNYGKIVDWNVKFTEDENEYCYY